MTGVVASPVATLPREHGWRWFVVALAVVLVIAAAPSWPPALALLAGAVRLIFPLEQVVLLTVVCFASCAIVGWWAGGRVVTTLLGLALAFSMLTKVQFPPGGYGGFVVGWSVALGAAFGVVCLASRQRPFLGRAIAAVALTFGVWECGTATGSSDSVPFMSSVQMLDGDYQRRLDESLAVWKNRTESGAWQAFAARLPYIAARADGAVDRLQEWERDRDARSRSWAIVLAPALLALESVLALALAWTSYHRLTRTRIGPPLGALRHLRFSDQWVWGMVLGATIAVVPSLLPWRVAGLNLLCFFGALYALRGAGVLSGVVPDLAALLALPVLLLLVSLLGALPVLVTLLVIALGAGLSDTWRDFRASAKNP